MSTETPTSLQAQRQALGMRLFLQRQRIHHLLAPADTASSNFPRSITMRLMTQHPDLAVRLAYQVALLLFRPRLVRGLGGAVLLSTLVYAAINREPAHDDPTR